jgi:UDP-N-acetylmuramoyl-L-alanyl-D-glutamate--2,6-diaminopimelate ligase
MQRVSAGEGQPEVVVDYAHTPDALDKAVEALRPMAQARGGQLWCVFGCGGDRDATKRPLMGAIAQRADRVVVTSDNPRREPAGHRRPDRGRHEGPAGSLKVQIEVDRRLAILQTLAAAGPQDVVLLAGKGHEDYQDVAGVKHPFSDLEVAQAGLHARSAA